MRELPLCKLSASGTKWEWAKIKCLRQCVDNCHISDWLKTQWFNLGGVEKP